VPPAQQPVRVAPLPARIAWAAARTLPCEGHVRIGVGGDELALLGADLSQGFTIAGPPRSGRSTALHGLACGLLAAGGAVCALTPRPSPLRELPGEADATELVEVLNAAPDGLAVVVDDAELLLHDPVADVLGQVLREGRHHLVVAGTVDGLAGAFRGFAADIRRSRSGLLLGPVSHLDGELLGVRLPRSAVAPGPVGRGLLIRNGEPTAVQVPV
jgi:S-DNA-T family DNA segregation ATPase FtsK/SpoIIIE